MLRTCTKCGVEKPIERFVRQKEKYRNQCKDCKNEKRRTGKQRPSFPKGNIPWNKGLKERTSKTRIYKPLSKETKLKISQSKKGKSVSLESKEKRKLNWLLKKIDFSRRSEIYKDWRNQVLERDGYKCTKCQKKENLHVHHLLPYDKYPEKRIDIDNGLTLCVSCHLSLEKKGHVKSEETRKKLSVSLKGRNGTWLGRSHTEESKIKMKLTKLGKKNLNYPKNRKSRKKV